MLINLQLIITFMCSLFLSGKSSDVVLNAYGSVFDVMDVDKKNLFNLKWPGQKPETDSNVDNYESVPVIIKTARKEQYSCFIPNKKNSEEDGSKVLDPNPYTLLATSFKNAQISPCSYRLESYWTYEVCHGRYIRQYHENKENPKKPELQEFMLGKFDEENFLKAEKFYEENPDKFTPPVKRIEGNDFAFIEVNMTDGTLCDLNNKRRKAVVKYVCYPDGLNHLYSFHEIVTCEYEIVILSPTLCKHSAFRMKMTTEASIKCYAEDHSSKKPKDLKLLELESAKERFSSAKMKLKIIGMEHIEEDKKNQKPSENKVQVNIKLKDIPPERPPTEVKNVRQPPLPQNDENLKKDFLSGSFCLIGGSGWWQYRFCFQKRVEQFHRDRGEKTIHTILLGTWNGVKPEFTEKIGEHVSTYNNGDICDATGKPRQVVVRLKCLKTSTTYNSVSMVLDEPQTCQYVLKVESPILCVVTDSEAVKPSS